MTEYRPIEKTEYSVLETFLWEAIFIPKGIDPLPREVIRDPSLYHYIKDFGKEGDVCYVCDVDGEIVGAAWSRILDKPNDTGFGNIGAGIPELSISVLPEARNKGIGAKLLRRLHADLTQRGYRQISLSVQKANAALRLYERNRYRITKEQETDYIMVCDLRAN
jgi:ribosomal protein S18 acetylase RimI-like enzyme